jgi:hypothetical protein
MLNTAFAITLVVTLALEAFALNSITKFAL